MYFPGGNENTSIKAWSSNKKRGLWWNLIYDQPINPDTFAVTKETGPQFLNKQTDEQTSKQKSKKASRKPPSLLDSMTI